MLKISCPRAVGEGVTMYWIHNRHRHPSWPAWKLLEEPPIQGVHCRKTRSSMGEDKLKTRRDCLPAPGVESVFRCYSTMCQAVWRQGGPDKGRMGLVCPHRVWLTAPSLLAVSEARERQNRTCWGPGSSGLGTFGDMKLPSWLCSLPVQRNHPNISSGVRV